MATYPFSNGVSPQAGWGDRWKMGFSGTWLAGETWTYEIASTNGLFTIGLGQLAGLTPTCALVLGDRAYLGMGTRFNLSSIGDVTLWEEQNVGAGFVDYRSQYGVQDAIASLAVSQGRLAVLANRTIQIWATNADPAQFSLIQVLDNIGTRSRLATQQLGDFDVIFLDKTGFRSLRSRELTLNAYVDDIGSPIDSIIQANIAFWDAAGACAIVEPSTKRYWCYVNGKIYVLSRYLQLKIAAWSTYLPQRDIGGVQTTFTPVKFITHEGLVYCVDSNGNIIQYGGSDNDTYDGCVLRVELPWLDAKTPNMMKQGLRVDAALTGEWQLEFGADPRNTTPTQVIVPYQVAPAQDVTQDSTFTNGMFPGSQKGTHFKIKAYTSPDWDEPAVFSAVTIQYNQGNEA